MKFSDRLPYIPVMHWYRCRHCGNLFVDNGRNICPLCQSDDVHRVNGGF